MRISDENSVLNNIFHILQLQILDAVFQTPFKYFCPNGKKKFCYLYASQILDAVYTRTRLFLKEKPDHSLLKFLFHSMRIYNTSTKKSVEF